MVKASDSAILLFIYIIYDMYKCKYCGKPCKNLKSLAQHEIRCKQNPNRIDFFNSSNNLIEYNKKLRSGEVIKVNSNQYTKAKNLGLPAPKISEETRQKISVAASTRIQTEETREKISTSMQRVVREKPESYSASNINGRVKKVEYNGIILDSSWEVMVAKYLDDNNIVWERPKNGFDYEYKGKTHIYYPDFYIPLLDTYVEVKGYVRPNDKFKWQSVPNLIVISKEEIPHIKDGSYKLLDII